jgi:hypothetical protein
LFGSVLFEWRPKTYERVLLAFLKNINNPGLFVNPDQTSIPIGGLMSILNILKLPEVIEVII